MIKIDDFIKSWGEIQTKSIQVISDRWAREKKVDDFLGTPVAGGYLIGDLLVGEGINDETIPFDVREGFKNLMGEKADAFEDVRNIIVEKIENGDDSILGLINKIQGQLGEDQFISSVGSIAKLADSGSQEGWDVRVNHPDGPQFVSVKVYEDADGVIEKMVEVNEKIKNGIILDNGIAGGVVKEIDFAVNSDIYDEVKERAREMNLPNMVIDIGATREEMRSSLEHAAEVAKDSSLENYFEELFGGTLTTGAIHAATQGFLVWKGAKTANEGLIDGAYSTVISSAGITAAMAIEAALTIVPVPGSGIAAVAAGMGTRAVLKRITNRRCMVKRMIKGNEQLLFLVKHFEIQN